METHEAVALARELLAHPCGIPTPENVQLGSDGSASCICADGVPSVKSVADLLRTLLPDGFAGSVSAAPSPDGAAIYVCDWQHVDTKEEVEVGRLLKLSYAGATNGAPKPKWYRAKSKKPESIPGLARCGNINSTPEATARNTKLEEIRLAPCTR